MISKGLLNLWGQLTKNKPPTKRSKSNGRTKWIRKKDRKPRSKMVGEGDHSGGGGKRQLVDVFVAEGSLEECGGTEKKKYREKMDVDQSLPEVVLEPQHRLHQ